MWAFSLCILKFHHFLTLIVNWYNESNATSNVFLVPTASLRFKFFYIKFPHLVIALIPIRVIRPCQMWGITPCNTTKLKCIHRHYLNYLIVKIGLCSTFDLSTNTVTLPGNQMSLQTYRTGSLQVFTGITRNVKAHTNLHISQLLLGSSNSPGN